MKTPAPALPACACLAALHRQWCRGPRLGMCRMLCSQTPYFCSRRASNCLLTRDMTAKVGAGQHSTKLVAHSSANSPTVAGPARVQVCLQSCIQAMYLLFPRPFCRQVLLCQFFSNTPPPLLQLADVGFTRALGGTHHSVSGSRVGTFDCECLLQSSQCACWQLGSGMACVTLPAALPCQHSADQQTKK